MKKMYKISRKDLGREIVLATIFLFIDLVIVCPVLLDVLGLIWQKDMHGFGTLIKIVGFLYFIVVFALAIIIPVYYVYFAIQRTLYEQNAKFFVDEDALSMVYQNEHLEQKRISFTYSDIDEIVQRAHRGTHGYYWVTLRSGERFIITAYMEGFVPIAKKFQREHPENFHIKGGDIRLPRQRGGLFL